MYDVLCIGSIYSDVNCLNFPFDGVLDAEETIGGKYLIKLGGSAVICALVSARLGLRTVFVGKVGKDIFGEWTQSSLKQYNVESALIVAEEVQTNLSLNFINHRGDKLMAVVGSANQSLTPDEVDSRVKPYLPKIKNLYFGGYFKLNTITNYHEELVGYARKNDARVILDHGRIPKWASREERERLRTLISQVDIYLPSEEEFKILWEIDDVEECLISVQERMRSGIVVVKQGERGAIGIDETGELFRGTAFHVKPRNTVGAGDSFNAGFLIARKMGYDLKNAILFGNATAALKISRVEIPKFQEVADLYEKKI